MSFYYLKFHFSCLSDFFHLKPIYLLFSLGANWTALQPQSGTICFAPPGSGEHLIAVFWKVEKQSRWVYSWGLCHRRGQGSAKRRSAPLCFFFCFAFFALQKIKKRCNEVQKVQTPFGMDKWKKIKKNNEIKRKFKKWKLNILCCSEKQKSLHRLNFFKLQLQFLQRERWKAKKMFHWKHK